MELPKNTQDILRLPSVDLAGRSILPESSGLYYVMDKSRVVYVGRSHNLKQRWSGTSHHRLAEVSCIDGVRLHWLEINPADYSIEQAEARAIELFNPPINRSPVRDARHIELEKQIENMQKQIEIHKMMTEKERLIKRATAGLVRCHEFGHRIINLLEENLKLIDHPEVLAQALCDDNESAELFPKLIKQIFTKEGEDECSKVYTLFASALSVSLQSIALSHKIQEAIDKKQQKLDAGLTTIASTSTLANPQK